jgi:hypothetical protein
LNRAVTYLIFNFATFIILLRHINEVFQINILIR